MELPREEIDQGRVALVNELFRGDGSIAVDGPREDSTSTRHHNLSAVNKFFEPVLSLAESLVSAYLLQI